MRTKEIQLSETGLFQLLQTIGCLDLPLLDARPGGARDYLSACREWEQLGWGEPDFDGGFQPSRLFARLVYSLKRTQCVMKYCDCAGNRVFYLRGAVDLIRLERAAGEEMWRLSFRPLGEARRDFSGELAASRGGALQVQAAGEEASEIRLEDTPEGSGERLRAINDQLIRFYPAYTAKGEATHADEMG